MSAIEIIYLIISILLIIVILLQQRGAGLGEAFGGTSSTFSSRRGAEKSLYQITIILAICFIFVAVFTLYLKSKPQLPDSVQPATEEVIPADATNAEQPTAEQAAIEQQLNGGETTNQ